METITNSEDTITFKRSHFYSVLVVLAFAVGILTGYVVWGRTSPQTQVAANDQPVVQAPAVTQRPNSPVMIFQQTDSQALDLQTRPL